VLALACRAADIWVIDAETGESIRSLSTRGQMLDRLFAYETDDDAGLRLASLLGLRALSGPSEDGETCF
jgi:hypothetical protein